MAKSLVTSIILMQIALLVTTASEQANAQKRVTPQLNKLERVHRVLKSAEELSRIAALFNPERLAGRPMTDRTRKDIQHIIVRTSDPTSLFMLGNLCKGIITSQNAEDRGYDEVFEAVFWQCSHLLAENTSDEAVNYLQTLASGLHGGEKLTMDEYVNEQKKKGQDKRAHPL